LPPAGAGTGAGSARPPRRRPKPGGKEDPPDCARRDTQAELEQLAADPRVAPTWVLAREAQHELAQPTIERRTAGSPLGLRPLPPHKLPVPAQKRLRPHHQAAASATRATRVFSELAAPVPDPQPQQSRESEIGEVHARVRL